MPENGDRELARLFADLRRADAAATPGFRHVLERSRARSAGAPAPLARVVGLTALAAVAVLAALLLRAPRKPAGENSSLSLAQWTSPTDVLLRTPGSELLEQPPALIEPAPDYADFDRSSPQPGGTTPPTVHPSSKGEPS